MPSRVQMRWSTATGAPVMWPRRLVAMPMRRRQAMRKLPPAAMFSTDCSALPPGSCQSGWGWASGMEKSTPFSVGDASTESAAPSTGMR